MEVWGEGRGGGGCGEGEDEKKGIELGFNGDNLGSGTRSRNRSIPGKAPGQCATPFQAETELIS